MSLSRLGYLLAIGVLTTVALWPWVQGAPNLALSQFTGWLVSGISPTASRIARWPGKRRWHRAW